MHLTKLISFYNALQSIDLNQHFASLIKSSNEFALVTEPSFALSVFRLTPELPRGLTEAQQLEKLNSLNRVYYGKLNARPDIYLTQTMLNDTFCIRFAVGAARTTKAHIDRAGEILKEEASVVVREWLETKEKV